MMAQHTGFSASLNWINDSVALMRIHEYPHSRYGDPYVWWTAIIRRPGNVAEFQGADRPFPQGATKAARDVLRANGFESRTYDRRSGGSIRQVIRSL